MVTICPTCGAVTETIDSLSLSLTERAIYDYIAKRAGCNITQIFSAVYSHRADGGPLSINVISVMISKINKKLTSTRICSSRGPGATYRLVEIKAPANASL